MMIETTEPSLADLIKEDYISFADFTERYLQYFKLPYVSEFSFAPFQRKFQDRLKETGLKMSSNGTNGIEDFQDSEDLQTVDIQRAVAKYLPSVFNEESAIFLSSPFTKDFRYLSPKAQELFEDERWELKIKGNAGFRKKGNHILELGLSILDQFYDHQTAFKVQPEITLRHRDLGIEKTYLLRLDFSHIEIKPTAPLKNLSQSEIQHLLRNVDDQQLWLEAFPPENFHLLGFSLGTFVDVTKSAILTRMKDSLDNFQERSEEEYLGEFGEMIASYLDLPDLKIGFVGLLFAQLLQDTCHSLSSSNDLTLLTKGTKGQSAGIYSTAFERTEPVLCENLEDIEHPAGGEELLLAQGYKSVILFPTMVQDNTVSMIFELASKTANAFDHLTVLQLQEVFELMQLGNDRFLDDLQTRVGLFVQEQFTSIHPSVDWRFEEVARNFLLMQSHPGFHGEIEEIVFKDVYPLYGQADIVGSSNLRNSHIQADLLDNLQRVLQILDEWETNLSLYYLQAVKQSIITTRERLEANFTSRDESEIVEFLKFQVHPYLHQLVEQFDELPLATYQQYFAEIDPELQIIYHKRKDYEQSVTRLNQAISTLLEEKNKELQNILPHYFEKYKTDGVEYNIYLGQSILQHGKFRAHHLKEFRLWQLIQMCEIARLVKSTSESLPVSLETAQLIVIYNAQLSIRFRMDEKQFDVDGTYNVRYEILKKRIDKSLIKNTKDRLTQSGTVSIVYLQDRDRTEYLQYLSFIQQKGYIDGDIEDLELEKLQGAEGLRALRFTVS